MSEAGHNNLLQIAQVLKSNGTDGGLMIGLHDITTEDIKSEEPVFIYFDGLPVPFFIESFQLRGTSRALVRLNDIHSLQDAEEIVGQGVYAETSSLENESVGEDELDIADLIGWTLLDGNGIKVGTITDFEDIPGNTCLYVDTDARDGEDTKNGQAMIPLHEDLILSVDSDAKELQMIIPDGLI
jgi:16S rRNA processing protein RimM